MCFTSVVAQAAPPLAPPLLRVSDNCTMPDCGQAMLYCVVVSFTLTIAILF
jgi:hypothetical protein